MDALGMEEVPSYGTRHKAAGDAKLPTHFPVSRTDTEALRRPLRTCDRSDPHGPELGVPSSHETDQPPAVIPLQLDVPEPPRVPSLTLAHHPSRTENATDLVERHPEVNSTDGLAMAHTHIGTWPCPARGRQS
jgi:hypothetical protein